MQVDTPAIVLKIMNYSESSIIARIFTRDLGYRSYIINGIRRKKQSQKSALYRPMNIIRLIAFDKNPEKLQRIKESTYEVRYEDLPFNVRKSAIGFFCIEILTNCLKDLVPHQELFDFVSMFYKELDEAEMPKANYYLFFAVKIYAFMGVSPVNNYSELNNLFNIQKAQFTKEDYRSISEYQSNEKTSFLLSQFLESDWTNFNNISVSRAEAKQLLNVIIKYFKYHIENFKDLKSLSVLETIFSPA